MAQNGVFERCARGGYVLSGLLHLTIGYLAIRIALGSRGETADQSGALAALAAKPGGVVALWVAAAAFLVMGLWRLVETALGRSTDPKSQGAPSEAWIGERLLRWRWSISGLPTPRWDSPGVRGDPAVSRTRG
jgi:hypothetical protein